MQMKHVCQYENENHFQIIERRDESSFSGMGKDGGAEGDLEPELWLLDRRTYTTFFML